MPSSRNEDVAGLEIAVDDAVLVRELHGARHLPHQLQARFERQAVRLAVRGDRHSRDVLHDEVCLAGRRHSTVEQRDDVGMLERGQNLPLGAESARRFAAARRRVRDLDRDAVPEEAIGALGEVHVPHAAFADMLDEAIWANGRSDAHAIRRGDGVVVFGHCDHGAIGCVQEVAEPIVGIEERLDLGAKLRPSGAAVGEDRRAGQRRHMDDVAEDGLELAEFLARKLRQAARFLAHAVSDRWSQARANVQCLFTVAGAMSRSAAVS